MRPGETQSKGAQNGILLRGAWFTFGVFASWVMGLDLSIIMDSPSSRGNSIEGLVTYNVGALFLSPWIGFPFLSWYAFRWLRIVGAPRSTWIPLLAGLSHPVLSGLLVVCLGRWIDPGHVGRWVPFVIGTYTCLGHPILAAELAFRFERPPGGATQRKRTLASIS